MNSSAHYMSLICLSRGVPENMLQFRSGHTSMLHLPCCCNCSICMWKLSAQQWNGIDISNARLSGATNASMHVVEMCDIGIISLGFAETLCHSVG